MLGQELTNVYDEVGRRVLQSADVVGVTATGLAQRIATLKRLRSKVIMCEEASEILEGHMLSTLLLKISRYNH